MSEKQKITRDGWNKINDELDELIKVKRPQIVQAISVAREQGDLSENAEYKAAKEEQRSIDDRIHELNVLLDNCEIMDDSNISNDVISLGSQVTVYDEDMDEEFVYFIVNTAEADLSVGKISIKSKLGEALLGKKAGDRIEVNAPGGVFGYKILKIGK